MRDLGHTPDMGKGMGHDRKLCTETTGRARQHERVLQMMVLAMDLDRRHDIGKMEPVKASANAVGNAWVVQARQPDTSFDVVKVALGK